jgi:hypothetical protein
VSAQEHKSGVAQVAWVAQPPLFVQRSITLPLQRTGLAGHSVEQPGDIALASQYWPAEQVVIGIHFV